MGEEEEKEGTLEVPCVLQFKGHGAVSVQAKERQREHYRRLIDDMIGRRVLPVCEICGDERADARPGDVCVREVCGGIYRLPHRLDQTKEPEPDEDLPPIDQDIHLQAAIAEATSPKERWNACLERAQREHGVCTTCDEVSDDLFATVSRRADELAAGFEGDLIDREYERRRDKDIADDMVVDDHCEECGESEPECMCEEQEDTSEGG
jgi:hypothetical protein